MSKVFSAFRHFIHKDKFIPVLGAIFLFSLYPAIFLYSKNFQLVKIQSIFLPLFISFFLHLLIFITYQNLLFRNMYLAILATFITSLGFISYGPIYDLLIKIDLFPINHGLFLIPSLLITVYFSTILPRLFRNKSETITKGLVILCTGLILYNLSTTIPTLITFNHTVSQLNTCNKQAHLANPQNTKRPDIYYLVIDEGLGFKQASAYWSDPVILDYAKTLENRGFFVALDSKSKTTHTLVEIASRLNFHYINENYPVMYEVIAHNCTMKNLKSLGYTTIVFDYTRNPLFFR